MKTAFSNLTYSSSSEKIKFYPGPWTGKPSVKLITYTNILLGYKIIKYKYWFN